MREEELLQKLRKAFQVEAEERLASLFTHLEGFEKASDEASIQAEIEILFREAHSLKGAARAVNLGDVEHLCQALEGVFFRLKKGEKLPREGLNDLFYDVVSCLETIIRNPAAVSGERPRLQELLLRLAAVEEGGCRPAPLCDRVSESAFGGLSPGDNPPPAVFPGPPFRGSVSASDPSPSPGTGGSSVDGPGSGSESVPAVSVPVSQRETVRVAAARIDELMRTAEAFIAIRFSLSQYARQLNGILREFSDWERNRRERRSGSTRAAPVRREALEQALGPVRRMVGELKELSRQLNDDRYLYSSLVDDLLARVRKIAMQPLDTLFAPMPRMVRELSRELGKRVEFEADGGIIEVDRRVLEEMRDPLVHLLRNALDHGIESAAERREKGKDPVARIRCTVSQRDASSIDIVVADDGRGLDAAAIREKARSHGLLETADGTELPEDKICDLIFSSGLSTSPIITAISGRGLGMAIVREKVENLGGRVRVVNKPGEGCEFHIHLPVTVAISRGIRVLAGGRKFIFPSLKVERVLLVDPAAVAEIEGRKGVQVEDEFLPLLELARMLQLTAGRKIPGESRKQLVLVVIGRGDGRRALLVDRVLGEQEILVKNLGRQLLSVPCIEGVTILGTGEVVPILKVQDLLAVDATSAAPTAAAAEESEPARLLVVDDSIISRMLLKNILETAGYRVETAIDGRAALKVLQNEDFDLVVTDVEMPFVDGFALTAEIRQDKRLADLPVVLVTSLGSREDRERGVAVGADAYIVKGEFDQQNLLEVVGSLIQE